MTSSCTTMYAGFLRFRLLTQTVGRRPEENANGLCLLVFQMLHDEQVLEVRHSQNQLNMPPDMPRCTASFAHQLRHESRGERPYRRDSSCWEMSRSSSSCHTATGFSVTLDEGCLHYIPRVPRRLSR